MRTRTWLRLGVLGVVAAVAGSAAGSTEARFTDAAPVGGNVVSSATLQPPTGLLATAGCAGATPVIALAWTATTSAFAEGYDLLRSGNAAGPYTTIAHVTGRSAGSYTDLAGLGLNIRYFYVARSTAYGWTSADSKSPNARTPRTCP
jgi:hypothetical protein